MQACNLTAPERRDVLGQIQGRWDFVAVPEGLHVLYGEEQEGKRGGWQGAHSAEQEEWDPVLEAQWAEWVETVNAVMEMLEWSPNSEQQEEAMAADSSPHLGL